MGRQFRSSQPPGAARPHSDLRITSLRWTRQEPTNVATVSQFAAPSGPARPHSDLRMTPLLWTPPGPTSVATVSHFAAPWDGEASL